MGLPPPGGQSPLQPVSPSCGLWEPISAPALKPWPCHVMSCHGPVMSDSHGLSPLPSLRLPFLSVETLGLGARHHGGPEAAQPALSPRGSHRLLSSLLRARNSEGHRSPFAPKSPPEPRLPPFQPCWGKCRGVRRKFLKEEAAPFLSCLGARPAPKAGLSSALPRGKEEAGA